VTVLARQPSGDENDSNDDHPQDYTAGARRRPLDQAAPLAAAAANGRYRGRQP
jgi:hypothetical protein